MENKNNWRKYSSSALAFFLAIMIFGVHVIIGLNLGVFRNETIEAALQDSEYFNESYERFQGEVATLLSETDLPLDLVYETVSLKYFYIDARSYTQRSLAGNGVENPSDIPVGVSKEELLTTITKYYEEKDIHSNEEQLTKLEEISDTVITLYKEEIDFSLADQIAKYRDTFVKVSALVVVGVIVLGTISIVLLNKMHKQIHNALRYIAISMLSASIMLLVFVVMLYYRVDYGAILKEPAYYNKFIEIYASESVKAFVYPAILGILLYQVFLVVIKELKRKAARQSW